jgi:hypothetical protein
MPAARRDPARRNRGAPARTPATRPLNGLRHPTEGETCGWYIWGGPGSRRFQNSFSRSTLPTWLSVALAHSSISPCHPVGDSWMLPVTRTFGTTPRYWPWAADAILVAAGFRTPHGQARPTPAARI